MKAATVREVQHGLASVLLEVQKGQVFAITKHGKVIAHIVPATRAKGRPRWPNSAMRMKKLMGGKTVQGVSPSEIIRELRGERI